MKTLIVSGCMVAVLSACGGGGGGGGGGLPIAIPPAVPPASQPEPPAAAPGSLQTSVAQANYAANSGEGAAYAYLQKARNDCGFGLLQQNAKLDQAAKAHSRYLIAAGNDTTAVVGHGEDDVNNPFFTGASPFDRASAAGYGTNVVEDLSATTEFYGDKTGVELPTASARGEGAMRSLLNTVAHLVGAMSPGKEIGFGIEQKNVEKVSGSFTTLRIDYRFGLLVGSQSGTQLVGAGNVASYPCGKTVGLDYAFAPATEDPNPFPEIVDQSAKVGPPLYIRTDEGNLLTVKSFGLKDDSGADIAVRTDVGGLGQHEFFMVPRAPLKPGKSYTARFEGTANGKNFTQAFTFTTKS